MHEADLPAEPGTAEAGARFPCQDEQPCRSGHHQAAACKGAAEAGGLDSVEVGMANPVGRLRRADRLRRAREFSQVTGSGQRAVGRSFIVVVAMRHGGQQRVGPRLGITVSRRVGNAVARNQLKRQIRDWFRSARGGIPPERDVVVIARRGAVNLSSAVVRSTLGRLLEEAGGLRS